MMNQSPEEQRRRVATEASLRNEVRRLAKEAMDKGLISSSGDAPSTAEKPWMIQQNGKEEHYTLKDAKSKLEKILNNEIF